MIITTNEEDGMSGAFHVSSSWLENASFLINVDNEWSTQILVSTASADTLNASKTLEYQNASGNKAIQIEISNLKGGHSGVEIDKGRLNGIIALAKFLKDLNTQKIDYELSSFEGRVAPNAIPTEAKAILVIDSTNLNTIKQKMEEYCAALNKTYEKTENEIICTVTEFSNIPKIVSSTEKITLINVLTDVIDGIYTMSKDMEGLVESSSNLGKVNMSPLSESVEIITTIRSSNPEKETEIINQQKNLTLSNGFTNNDINIEHTADAWQFDPNSKLAELAKTIYKRQNKEDVEVVAVHAGIECGRFKNLNK
jgi:dipeptidase D